MSRSATWSKKFRGFFKRFSARKCPRISPRQNSQKSSRNPLLSFSPDIADRLVIQTFSMQLFCVLGSILLPSIGEATPAQILIIRHGEKPPGDAPNLNEQGRQRSGALAFYFQLNPLVTDFGPPVAIYTFKSSGERDRDDRPDRPSSFPSRTRSFQTGRSGKNRPSHPQPSGLRRPDGFDLLGTSQYPRALHRFGRPPDNSRLSGSSIRFGL